VGIIDVTEGVVDKAYVLLPKSSQLFNGRCPYKKEDWVEFGCSQLVPVPPPSSYHISYKHLLVVSVVADAAGQKEKGELVKVATTCITPLRTSSLSALKERERNILSLYCRTIYTTTSLSYWYWCTKLALFVVYVHPEVYMRTYFFWLGYQWLKMLESDVKVDAHSSLLLNDRIQDRSSVWIGT